MRVMQFVYIVEIHVRPKACELLRNGADSHDLKSLSNCRALIT